MYELGQSEKVFNPTKSPELFHPTTKEQRQANWRIMEKRFTTVTDRLGESMDERIIEPVVGLSLLGIRTAQSCEGHLDHGNAYPWISISAKPTPELEKLQEAERKLYEPNAPYTPDELKVERVRVHRAITAVAREPNLAEARKAALLLEEFYGKHQVPQGQRLVVTFGPRGDGRLLPQSGEAQENNDQTTKEQMLIKFRQEMAAFAAFLKSRYIGE